MSRAAAIDRTASDTHGVLRNVGGDVYLAARIHEADCAVAPVGADRDPNWAVFEQEPGEVTDRIELTTATKATSETPCGDQAFSHHEGES